MKYHEVCLRKLRIARSSPRCSVTSRRACSAITSVHLAEQRRGLHGATAERIHQVAKQPWAAEAATTHHHPVAAGVAHHPHRVGGFPDVAVAEHGNLRHGLLQLGDRGPVSLTGVVLLGGAGVQRDRGDTLLGGDAAGLHMGEQVSYRPLRNLIVTGTPYG